MGQTVLAIRDDFPLSPVEENDEENVSDGA